MKRSNDSQKFVRRRVAASVLCGHLLSVAGTGLAFDSAKSGWAILGGYGQSIPDWGLTTQRAQTLDIALRYSLLTIDNMGSGWYRGYHSTMLELPVHLVLSPDESAMVGFNFLARYTFTAGKSVNPYVFGGGGPVYSFADIPGMGADFNGNYQFGVGLEYDWHPQHKLFYEIRYHHISNMGIEEPNEPLNSLKLLVGMTF